jgi:hypothetical protein
MLSFEKFYSVLIRQVPAVLPPKIQVIFRTAAYGLVSAIVIARADRGDSFRARKLPSTSTRFGRSPPGGVTQ